MKRQETKRAKPSKGVLRPLSGDVAACEEPGSYGRLPRKEPDPRVDALARTVIGAALAVHRELGPGYPEIVYQRALAVELRALSLPFVRERSFSVRYRDADVGEGQLDFLVDDLLVVELKAVELVLPLHRAQVRSYLKALKLELALLINFNTRLLKDGIERIVRT